MPTFAVPNTPEMRYVKAYGAIVDALSRAAALFEVLSEDGSSAAIRDEARARSLEALMELQLAKEEHDAWMDGLTPIRAPSPAQVARTIDIAGELAQVTASEQKMTAIVALFTETVTAITAIHNAGAPAVVPPGGG